MPVLPEVDSITVVRPGSIRPSASDASIMATPILSLTEPAGLYASSFPITSVSRSPVRRLNCTIGVRPTRSARFAGIAIRVLAIASTIADCTAASAPARRRPGALQRISVRRVYFLHFWLEVAFTCVPVAKKKVAFVVHVFLHLLGATTRLIFLPPFLMVKALVVVFTVPTEASGALGSVLIGGIVEVGLYPPQCGQGVANVRPRSGRGYNMSWFPAVENVTLALPSTD